VASTQVASEKAGVAHVARTGTTLAAVSVVQFMVSLDLTVVNVGLPQIGSSLGFSEVGLTWVIHAYALTFGGLLLLGGKIADRYGYKRVMLFGLVLFGVSSLVGGLAQVPGQLVAARAVQGIGAAAVAPAALALLSSTFPGGKERVKAFGIWSAVNASGGAVGVLVGGLLTQYAGWQWVMFINLPMAALALLLAWRGIARDTPSARRGRPDVLGAVLATAGAALLVYGVVRTDEYAWTSPNTLITLAVAVVLLAAFVQVERTTKRDPLIRLGLFANRSVSGANIFMLLFGGAMASALYFVSLYLQRVLGGSPARAGAEFLPFMVGVVVGSTLAVKFGYKFAPRNMLIVGGTMAALGYAWFSLMRPDGTLLVDVLGPSVLASLGIGLCLAPAVSIATGGVLPHEAGAASGVLNSTRQIGASLGLAALGTVAADRTGKVVTAGSLNAGYALGMLVGAGMLAVAVLVAVFVLPRPARATADGAQQS